MNAPYERDLAHEADMRELQRAQLRGDVDVEEANASSREAYWDAVDLADGEVEDDNELVDRRWLAAARRREAARKAAR